MLIALLIGIRLWWGWVANRRLQAAIADLRARGEPVTDADFAEPPLPDEQNAAFYLKRAAAKIGPVLRDQSMYAEADAQGWYKPPLSGQAEQSLRRRLERTRHILADVRRARSAAGAFWRLGVPQTLDDLRPILDLYSGVRGLGDELTYAAREAHSSGDDRAAADYLLDGLFIERTFGHAHDVVSYMVAVGAGAVIVDEVQGEAHELRVGGSARDANRGQIHELIRELLDTSRSRAGLVRSFQYERAAATRAGVELAWYGAEPTATEPKLVRSPDWVNRPATVMFRPYAVLHSARVLRHSIPSVEAARQVDGGAFSALPVRRPQAETELPGVDAVASLFTENDPVRIIGVHRQLAATHASAARELATRLFELDHRRKPNSLQELVPHYLPVLTPYVPAIPPPATTLPATAPAARPATLPAP